MGEIITMDTIKAILSAISVLCLFLVDTAFGGECCKTYYDVTGDYHREIWCPVYCCGTYLVRLTCCDSALLRAAANMKVDFCLAWFYHSDNMWAIILIGVGGLVLLILMTIGFYCLCTRVCCKRKSRVIEVKPGATQESRVKEVQKIRPADDQVVEAKFDRPAGKSKIKDTDMKETKPEPAEAKLPNQPADF